MHFKNYLWNSVYKHHTSSLKKTPQITKCSQIKTRYPEDTLFLHLHKEYMLQENDNKYSSVNPLRT